MPKMILIGNCVSQRLAQLLDFLVTRRSTPLTRGDDPWQIVPAIPVYLLKQSNPQALKNLAECARDCDLVFSQPLFNYDACNTDRLRDTLGERLRIFSAPNFEAYFPDAIELGALREAEKFSPPLEWHSKIILQCKSNNIPVRDVEDIYLNHSLFRAPAALLNLQHSLQTYARREQGVDIGTLEIAQNYFASEPLFHTWNHPGDRILRALLTGMLSAAGLSDTDIDSTLAHIIWKEDGNPDNWSPWGFGFNTWPIITRNLKHFNFPGREYFRIQGNKTSITNCAAAYYKYYDAHPAIFAQALERI